MSSELFLPGLVLVIILILVGIGIFNRVIAKLGLRNFFRHKSHSVISIMGLLVGTSIICASMVVGDSIEYFIVEETYEQLGEVDVTIRVEGDGYFNYSVYTALESDPDLDETVMDGMSPIVASRAVVSNLNSGQFEPSVNIIGFDPVLDSDFGNFITLGGLEMDGSNIPEGGVMINDALAENLGAHADDVLTIKFDILGDPYGRSGEESVQNFSVSYIVQDVGKALFNPLPVPGHLDIFNLFIPLDVTQQMFNRTGMINLIKISNIGGVEEGAIGSEELALTIDGKLESIPGSEGIRAETKKQDMLEFARDINDIISVFLTIFGSFAIIAGVILIINIFTMLAEERKSELGMARAIGMKRRHLMQSFLFEGLAYGVIASAIGVIVGVAIGALLIYLVNNMMEFIEISIPVHFKMFSLAEAFALGFLITFVTILLTSWKISKLNIIRAIRGIEEPEKDKKTWMNLLLGLGLVALGALAYYNAQENYLVILVAPCAIITGIAMMLWRWIGSRATVSGSSLGVLLYCFYAIRTYFGDAEQSQVDYLFILSGVIIVLSFVLLVMYNSDPVIKLITGSFGRIKRFRPTIMTAVSYPLTKKFRTGMTVAMFALVVYMIAMLSVFSTMFVMDVDDEAMKQGGGFDIQGTTQFTVADLNNLGIPLPGNVSRMVQLSSAFTTEINVTDGGESHNPMGFEIPGMMGSTLFGIDDNFIANINYTFSKMLSENYTDAQAVWAAVNEPGSRKVVISTMVTFINNADVGNNITFVTNPYIGTVTEEFEVIGVVDQNILAGVFISKENLMLNFGVSENKIFLFDVGNYGLGSIEATARALERDFAEWGMNTVMVYEVAEQTVETTNSLFVLFEIYLDMGMVVGVAGLGVITVRSVVERTPEIGVLRSLGFKRKNIRNAFLIEILFVATLGVIIGLVSGILVAHEIFTVIVGNFDSSIQFSIPWMKIGIVVAIAYIATILCTVIPAHNASKISPAEALRYVG